MYNLLLQIGFSPLFDAAEDVKGFLGSPCLAFIDLILRVRNPFLWNQSCWQFHEFMQLADLLGWIFMGEVVKCIAMFAISVFCARNGRQLDQPEHILSFLPDHPK
jgi:hypothetical protein